MSLVLTLKKEDFINISGPVTVTLVQIKGNQVRLSFDCDRSVDIQRSSRKNPPKPIMKEYKP